MNHHRSIEVRHSVCALDCPDACSLHIQVQGNQVVGLTGDPSHPITRGFACVKTARYPERQEQADRLLQPMRRCGDKGLGKFEPISWEEALDEIAHRLQCILDKHGPQSVLPYHYAGTMGVIQGDSPSAFFRAMGALELDQTICATTGGSAWEANYGPNKIGTDPEDLIHSKFIILWGINVLRSNSHLAPILKEARRRGAKILHIDPYRNETSRFADEHWQIRVGTDAALALAIGQEILSQGWEDRDYLDRYAQGLDQYQQACQQWTLPRASEYCDVPLEALQAMVRKYATGGPSFIKVGYGMTRNEGGGNACRAITLLPALIGSWKQQGAGAVLSTSGGFQLNRRELTGAHRTSPPRRHVNMNCLASELLDHAKNIRALMVYNSNPAAVAPDSARVRQGLSREDLFTVVLEHFQTDTADYADYLLPATTFLEHPDIYTSYGHYYLQYADAVVPARGQAKTNRWIFDQLAKRIGLDVPELSWDPNTIIDYLLDSANPWLQGITRERLLTEKSIKLQLPKPFLPYSQGSHFSDGKIRFSPAPEQLEFQEKLDRDYPLRLISPPGAVVVNTTMGNVPSIIKLAGGEPTLLIHPIDAQEYGISDGQRIEVSSRYGTIVRKAIVTSDSKQGVVISVGQWWPKLSPDHKSLNDLTSERLTDLGGGSTFGNVAVGIRPDTGPKSL
ncbi:MAG: molybdopterin-dependent oxidoreductase [Planctomycetes bacterium]|nr:molybdopterin-dependent oxidoreductase [Planctomycetota bacterium]